MGWLGLPAARTAQGPGRPHPGICRRRDWGMDLGATHPHTLHHSPGPRRGRGAGGPGLAGLTAGRTGAREEPGGAGPALCAPAAGGRAPRAASKRAITPPPPGLCPGPALGTAPRLEAPLGAPSSHLSAPASGGHTCRPLQVHETTAAPALGKTRPSVEPPEMPPAALPYPPSLHPAEEGIRTPEGPGPLRTCAGKTGP